MERDVWPILYSLALPSKCSLSASSSFRGGILQRYAGEHKAKRSSHLKCRTTNNAISCPVKLIPQGSTRATQSRRLGNIPIVGCAAMPELPPTASAQVRSTELFRDSWHLSLFATPHQHTGQTVLLLAFDDHVILDRGHAFDCARKFTGLVDAGMRTDEARQLHDTLISFDIDFG